MKDKICLVTGANAGIGYETALGLAKLGATVILVCRSKEKGLLAHNVIVSSTRNHQVHLLLADLSSLEGIRKLAQEFLALYPKLDVLVNNVGVFHSEYGKTEDGLERQFAINHIGPFLLTHLLLGALKAAAPSRIVMVSSASHYSGRINFADLNGEKLYSGMKAYSQSKLANVLFANEFGRRYPDIGVTANSLHPGVVRTRIAQKDSKWYHNFGWAMMKPFMISAAKGAATSIFVATSPKLEGVTGKFFAKSREKKAAVAALDAEVAKRLWDESMKICGLA